MMKDVGRVCSKKGIAMTVWQITICSYKFVLIENMSFSEMINSHYRWSLKIRGWRWKVKERPCGRRMWHVEVQLNPVLTDPPLTVFRLKRMQIVNPYNLFPALGLNWFQQNGTHNRLDFQFLWNQSEWGVRQHYFKIKRIVKTRAMGALTE